MLPFCILRGLVFCVILATFPSALGQWWKFYTDQEENCPKLRKVIYSANGFSCCGPSDESSPICRRVNDTGGRESLKDRGSSGNERRDASESGGKSKCSHNELNIPVPQEEALKFHAKAVCDSFPSQQALDSVRGIYLSSRVSNTSARELGIYIYYCCFAAKKYDGDCDPLGDGIVKIGSWIFFNALGVLLTFVNQFSC